MSSLPEKSQQSKPTSLPIICPEGSTTKELNLEEVKWSDTFEDCNGSPKGVFDQEWSTFSSKQLRTICSRLSIKGIKNVKKSDMVDSLIAGYNNKKLYTTMQNRGDDDNGAEKSTRKQAQCPFRLMNILFLDEHAEGFSKLGNMAT